LIGCGLEQRTPRDGPDGMFWLSSCSVGWLGRTAR
jgi:hypothetical protein